MAREELLKVAKPILFNTKMVQAILEGRKACTRRAIKLDLGLADTDKNDSSYLKIPNEYGDYHDAKDLCRYQPGNILYVRETWLKVDDGYYYRADETPISKEIRKSYGYKWKPSIHMRKELARIFLKVTDVRVERLQDITEEQCLKEGIEGARCSCNGLAYACTDCYNTGWLEPPQVDFMFLWNSTIKKQDLDQYGWDANPWVWVIEFERAEED